MNPCTQLDHMLASVHRRYRRHLRSQRPPPLLLKSDSTGRDVVVAINTSSPEQWASAQLFSPQNVLNSVRFSSFYISRSLLIHSSSQQFLVSVIQSRAFRQVEGFGSALPVTLASLKSSAAVSTEILRAFGRGLVIGLLHEYDMPIYTISPAFWCMLSGEFIIISVNVLTSHSLTPILGEVFRDEAATDVEGLARRLLHYDPSFFAECLRQLSVKDLQARNGYSPPSGLLCVSHVFFFVVVLENIRQHLVADFTWDSVKVIRDSMLELLAGILPGTNVVAVFKKLSSASLQELLCAASNRQGLATFTDFSPNSLVPRMFDEVASPFSFSHMWFSHLFICYSRRPSCP